MTDSETAQEVVALARRIIETHAPGSPWRAWAEESLDAALTWLTPPAAEREGGASRSGPLREAPAA